MSDIIQERAPDEKLAYAEGFEQAIKWFAANDAPWPTLDKAYSTLELMRSTLTAEELEPDDGRDFPQETDLTPAEEKASNAIIAVMDAIRDLYDGNPHNFENEGIPAIHVLQKFVSQHWAHRVRPDLWGNWTTDLS